MSATRISMCKGMAEGEQGSESEKDKLFDINERGERTDLIGMTWKPTDLCLCIYIIYYRKLLDNFEKIHNLVLERQLHSFLKVAVTKCHKLNSLKKQKFIHSWSRRPEVWSWGVSRIGSFLGVHRQSVPCLSLSQLLVVDQQSLTYFNLCLTQTSLSPIT